VSAWWARKEGNNSEQVERLRRTGPSLPADRLRSDGARNDSRRSATASSRGVAAIARRATAWPKRGSICGNSRRAHLGGLDWHLAVSAHSEALLQQLKGARLVALGRAASLEHFTFRTTRDRELFLHVETPWRLTDASGIVAGRADYWRPATADTSEEALDAGLLGSTLRDVKNDIVRERIAGRPFVVTSFETDRLGGLVIRFGDELTLEIFPDASPAAHDSWEFWRLFERDQPHLVMSTDGEDLHGRPTE
jgi:hypothetical protein